MSVERLRRTLRGDLDNIILKALHKDPERRYALAEALSMDVERHLDRRPVLARPDTLVYRVNFLFRSVFSLIPLMATIYLWRAVYAGKAEGSDPNVAGYSLAALPLITD